MKKLKVFFLLYFFFILSCNNNFKKEINKFSNGRIKEICYRNDEDNYRIKKYVFYENGNLKSIDVYKNNELYKSTLFFDNGNLCAKLKLQNSKLIDTLYNFNRGKLRNKVVFGKNHDTIKVITYNLEGRLYDEYSVLEGDNFYDGPSNYLLYNTNGKIEKDSSHCVLIKYLNKKGTKFHFILNEYAYWINPLFVKDYVEVYIIPDFNYGPNWEKRSIRKIRFTDWNNVVLQLNEKDYIDGKVNLVVKAFQKSKFNNVEYISSRYEIQLIKGDKSRWHNVHGIEK